MPFREITLFVVTKVYCMGSWAVLFSWLFGHTGPRPLLWGFSITLIHTTLGRTSGRVTGPSHRPLYLTALDTHNRQTSMPPVGFELAIAASEQPQTHTSDRAATGIATWASDKPGDTYVALWQPVRERSTVATRQRSSLSSEDYFFAALSAVGSTVTVSVVPHSSPATGNIL